MISINALREEGDMLSRVSWQCQENFYPRPPRGGRHPQAFSQGMATIFLSTPSARRATDLTTIRSRLFLISIHALREEGDLCAGHHGQRRLISIHALREEGDLWYQKI